MLNNSTLYETVFVGGTSKEITKYLEETNYNQIQTNTFQRLRSPPPPPHPNGFSQVGISCIGFRVDVSLIAPLVSTHNLSSFFIQFSLPFFCAKQHETRMFFVYHNLCKHLPCMPQTNAELDQSSVFIQT